MTVAQLAPPLTALADLAEVLSLRGHAVLAASDVHELAGMADRALATFAPTWEALPLDLHLRDAGHYRRRRHACFVVDGGHVTLAPHRAHWQPLEYNALHGGLARWFEPMEDALVASPSWRALLAAFGQVASSLRGERRWYVEAHPFRIDAEGGIGRPTPEGAHRDGVDLVVVMLIARANIKGGETRVFDAMGPAGLRFTLSEPWSALVLDDARVIHESTPIQPVDAALPAHRDTLVLTYRSGGFQGDALALGQG